ncbi:hypothetical protein [Streptococcus pluranimalium]
MYESKKKKCRLKQRQSRNLLIVSLMKETGWKRERVVDALEELETFNLIKFPKQGGMLLKTGEVR